MIGKIIVLDTYIVKEAAKNAIGIDSEFLFKTVMSSFWWVFKEFWPYFLLLLGLKTIFSIIETKFLHKKKKSKTYYRKTYNVVEHYESQNTKSKDNQNNSSSLKSRIKGITGESTVFITLESLPKEYIPIHNVMLETDKGTTQIDHVVVSPYGVFSIETKNYKGWIYGKKEDYYWTQVLSGKKNSFYNPIKQNEGHIKALKRIIGDVPCYSIVVFSKSCELKTKPQGVVYEDELSAAIMAYRNAYLTKEQVYRLESIVSGENIIDRESRDAHVNNLRSRYGKR